MLKGLRDKIIMKFVNLLRLIEEYPDLKETRFHILGASGANPSHICNNLIYKTGWFGLRINQGFDNLIYFNNFTENINGQTMQPLNAEDNSGNNK